MLYRTKENSLKDMGKANKDFVKEKFDEFLKYLKENTII